ncbi:MAG: N-acetyl-gamma-glutamyl-phosphate reductase [Bacteroidia bacterium]|nr:N-acetyl-gamma-glutamyl-phosphate reductase [Bacteroidia bacterium]
MIKVGIIGGSGFAAGELIRLLLEHPQVDIKYIYSSSKANELLASVHQDLEGISFLQFSDQIDWEIDLLFLCMGHGQSRRFLTDHSIPDQVKIVDLSRDFRLTPDHQINKKEFIYGLPELNGDRIKQAKYVANPGCFATAIQLGILPLADGGLIKSNVHINAVTGATGAGRSLSPTTHFTWRDNNFSYYKPFNHQHLDEINQSVEQLQPEIDRKLLFIPCRGNFSRGIFATLYTDFNGSADDIQSLYEDYYTDHVFTQVSNNSLHLKQVVNTNNCKIHLHLDNGILLITSVIDNLLKGASGQAVQNMNLMFGLAEDEGLKLKASYF